MHRDFTCAEYASVVLAAGGSAGLATNCTAGQKRVELAVEQYTLAYDKYTLITIRGHPNFTSFGTSLQSILHTTEIAHCQCLACDDQATLEIEVLHKGICLLCTYYLGCNILHMCTVAAPLT